MKQDEVKRWLEGLEVLDALSSDQERQAQELLGDVRFGIFLGLMLGARQGQLMTLSNMSLATAEAAARASVTQGIIKGIDMTMETALELGSPKDASAAPEAQAEEFKA